MALGLIRWLSKWTQPWVALGRRRQQMCNHVLAGVAVKLGNATRRQARYWCDPDHGAIQSHILPVEMPIEPALPCVVQ